MDTKTKLPTSLTDLGKPSLHALSYALRHPDVWPADFVWDYRDCDHCAMGLAHQLWSSYIPMVDVRDGASVMANRFAMSYDDAKGIFTHSHNWAPRKTVTTGHLLWKKTETVINYDAITPSMVADQIDIYLEKAE